MMSTLFENNSYNNSGYKLNIFKKIIFFILNPSYVKYYPRWNKTKKAKLINSASNTLDIQIPWVTYEAGNWLNNNLKSNAKIFEYGSGGSTIYYANKCKEVVSIEHDKKWFIKINKTLNKLKLNNIKYFLVEPQYSKKRQELKYNSQNFSKNKNISFKKYVKSIKIFENKYFDLISVDGRCRVQCIKEALPKIKDGGYLLLDNSERQIYKQGLNYLKKYKRKDYFGFGPYLDTFWKTTIWKII